MNYYKECPRCTLTRWEWNNNACVNCGWPMVDKRLKSEEEEHAQEIARGREDE